MTPEEMRAKLDEIEEKLAKATPGPIGDNMGDVATLTDAGKGYPLNFYPDSIDVVFNQCGDCGANRVGFLRAEDQALYIVLVNAAPELLAWARVGLAADPESGVSAEDYYAALRAARGAS